MINAPNAILNDLAGAPISVGKFWAYSDSNSDHGISWAIFTQRLSGDKLPPKGSSNSDGGFGASSTFRYTIAGGDARVLTYFTCLSCTLLSITRSNNPAHVKCDRLFSKPYLTQELSSEDDSWRNDTSGRSQIFVNKAAKLHRQEAWIIPQMPTTLA